MWATEREVTTELGEDRERVREREREREIDRRGICTVFQPRGESVLTQRGEVSLYD